MSGSTADRRRHLWLGLVLVVLVGVVGPASAGERLADRCFVVTIDGCAPRYLENCAVPNLRNLMRHGSWTWRAETVTPSLSLPAMASLVSGLLPRQHGVDWDRWEPTRGAMQATSMLTVVGQAGGNPAEFLAYQKMLHLIPPSIADSAQLIGMDDEDVMDRVIRDVFTQDRALWFVELGASEDAAKCYGWGSPEYLAALENADYQIGRLLDAIGEMGWSATSAMIVTSDHGGTGLRNDMPGPECQTIPWIVCGPRIRTNYEIAGKLRVYDTASTVVSILGLDVPTDWDGRPPLRVLGED
jgi:predicted AlkP superfamily pyrophosphatase or phosphodiesterase